MSTFTQGIAPAGIAIVPEFMKKVPENYEILHGRGLEKLTKALDAKKIDFAVNPEVHGVSGEAGRLASDLKAAGVAEGDKLIRQAKNLDKVKAAHTTATERVSSLELAAKGGETAKAAPRWARTLNWLNGSSTHATNIGENMVRNGNDLKLLAKTSGTKMSSIANTTLGTAKNWTGTALQRIPRVAWLGGAVEGLFQIKDMKDAIEEGNGRWVAQTARSATKITGAVGTGYAAIAASVPVAATVAGTVAKCALLGSIAGPVGTVVGAVAGLAVGIGIGWLGGKIYNGIANGLFGKNKKEQVAAAPQQVIIPQNPYMMATGNPYGAMGQDQLVASLAMNDPTFYNALYGQKGILTN